MKRSDLKKQIEEVITEILSEDLYAEKPGADPANKLPNVTTADKATANDPKFKTKYEKVSEAETEDEFDAPEKEPSKAELKRIDKEFNSSKFAKKLSPADKERLDKVEAGIKKKLANPTKDNIAIVKQLISKPEIKKLFKDGGKDLKALISDIIG
jgi:hypothetical protein